MPRFRGCLGVIKLDDKGTTPAAKVVGELYQFEHVANAPEEEYQVMGNCDVQVDAGPVRYTGTMSCWFADGDAAQDLIVAGAEAELYAAPLGESTGDPIYQGTIRFHNVPVFSGEASGFWDRSGITWSTNAPLAKTAAP